MHTVVFIPDFYLQASLRPEPDLQSRSVALVDDDETRPVIIQFNDHAGRHGIAAGLTGSQAMARCGNLVIRPRSRAQEQVATELLLQTVYIFSPCIESTRPGVCTLDLKGLGLQDSDIPAWAEKIRAALALCGLEAIVGIAATPGLAEIAACAAEPILHVRDPKEFLSTLPVAALQAPAEVQELLKRWGVRTAGEFLALGKHNLAERLGESALEIFDRVSPDFIRPLKLVPPPEEFTEQIEFEHEIETLEPMLFVLRRFVEQISRRLGLMHLVVAGFHLRLGLASSEKFERTFNIPSATGAVETLFRTIFTGLEGLRTDSPIVSLRLNATPCRPDTSQLGLFEVSLKNPNQFAETLARLMALCGSDRAGTPVPHDTHRPDSFAIKSPDFTAERAQDAPAEPPVGLQLRRFRPAVGATVEFRGRKPALIHSSVCKGGIEQTRGPFRNSGDWWDTKPWSREEWDIEAAGALYRIVFTETGCVVEGVYD